MKISIENTHREYFKENRCIAFEGLLKPKEVEELKNAIQVNIHRRLEIPLSHQLDVGDTAISQEGRDLWRESRLIRNYTHKRKWSEMVANIADEKPLRLACDHGMIWPKEDHFSSDDYFWADLIYKGKSLNEIISVQGITCGLIVCLQPPNTPPVEEVVFPSEAGDVLLISPDFTFDEINDHLDLRGGIYYLIVYSQSISLAVQRPQDRHGALMRKMGYTFGDRLNDKLHPIVYSQ